MSSIFINISAYHDYELPKTIDSAITNSSGENEISFGIHYVYDTNDDFNILGALKSKAPENLGVGVGRNIAHTLYKNEDYYLMIDSHTRFAKDWDKHLIADVQMYKDLGFNKPVITAYPASYFYVDGKEVLQPDPIPQNIGITNEKQFSLKLNPVNYSYEANHFYQHSISGGFTFTIKPFIAINKKIAFNEEFPLGAILYTNGYDLLKPTKMVLYHYYSGPSQDNLEAHNRRHVWQNPDNLDTLLKLQSTSDVTIIEMFKNKIVGPGFLGSERSLEQYAEYINVDFNKGIFL